MVQRPLPSRFSAVPRFLPAFSALVFILAGVLVLPFPYLGSVAPLMGLIALYYWSVYRPDLFRPLAVFALGLLNDSLHMLPLGLSAALYLSLHHLVLTQRRFFVGQTFLVLWTGFALVSLIAVAAQWAVLSLYEGQRLSLPPILTEYGLTLVFFPLPAWLLMRLQKSLLSQG